MNPELAAHRNSPHARVECVECHVAPGAAGWISSKTNGIRQLVETTLNTYGRPIPSALESNRLVPSRKTCENCHWPQKLGGVRLRVFSKFGDDEANSRTETVLMMMVGGDRVPGIHGAHFGPGVQIHFAAACRRNNSMAAWELREFPGDAERTAGERLSELAAAKRIHCVAGSRFSVAHAVPESTSEEAALTSVPSVFERRQGLQYFAGFRPAENRIVFANFSVPEDEHTLSELRDVVLVRDQHDS